MKLLRKTGVIACLGAAFCCLSMPLMARESVMPGEDESDRAQQTLGSSSELCSTDEEGESGLSSTDAGSEVGESGLFVGEAEEDGQHQQMKELAGHLLSLVKEGEGRETERGLGADYQKILGILESFRPRMDGAIEYIDEKIEATPKKVPQEQERCLKVYKLILETGLLLWQEKKAMEQREVQWLSDFVRDVEGELEMLNAIFSEAMKYMSSNISLEEQLCPKTVKMTKESIGSKQTFLEVVRGTLHETEEYEGVLKTALEKVRKLVEDVV